jgi:pilus assembly protein CpaE
VVQTTLRLLRQRFAIVVVDVPSVLDEGTMAALEAAVVVGLVVTAEAPSIQAAVGTLRALGQWSGKFQIILNQVTQGARLPTGAIQQTLRRPLLGTVPFDPDQARALAQRAPLALHSPTSPLAQAVQGLAQELSRSQQKVAVT